MTENRELALDIALGEYFGVPPSAFEFDDMSENELTCKINDGEFTVWEVFEDYPYINVYEFVDSLAYTIERTLVKKESFIKERITNMDSDQVFDWCQERN